MRLVLRALGDPAAEDLFLGGGERQMRFRRRHQFVGVAGKNATHDEALTGLAGQNGVGMRLLALGEGLGELIQPESRLARGLVRSMAFKTAVRENGADVAIELE